MFTRLSEYQDDLFPCSQRGRIRQIAMLSQVDHGEKDQWERGRAGKASSCPRSGLFPGEGQNSLGLLCLCSSASGSVDPVLNPEKV